jgi:hypothetical protein
MGKTRLDRAFRGFGFGLVALIVASVANAADADRNSQIEAKAVQVESLLGELLGSNPATPEYTDHGGGLHSLSLRLDDAQRERLSALFQEKGDNKAVTFYFLAGGQSQTPPSNASALVHAAVSNPQIGYNYWVAMLNFGADVTRNTTFRLTGPGRTFNRTYPLLYRSNTIWFYWYVAPSVGTPGFYRYASTVAGAGTYTTNSVAMNP